MYISSIFCSSDIIAAVTLVKFEEQPKLFSIILGEGLFNDAVAIILYQTMQKLSKSTAGARQLVSWETYAETAVSFLYLTTCSTLIGLICGFVAAFMTKNFRFISQNAILESSLFICFAMLSYFVSEVCHLSAIVTLLVTSLILSHYAWFNLSPQGKHVTSVTFQTLGYIAEAIVFGYIGLSFLVYYHEAFSWKFIVAELIIVVVGRFAAVYISYYLFACCPGKNFNLLTFR